MSGSLTLVWFSCARDYPMLAESVAAARVVWPGAVVAIFLDRHEREEPQIPCVEIHRTSWPRGGNLTSQEAPAGVANCLGAAAYEYGADAVVKIDSDTLVLDGRWAAGVTADQTDALAVWRLPGRPGLGAAYALRADAVEAVSQSFAAAPAWTRCEDLEIVGRAMLWAAWHGAGATTRDLGPDPAHNGLRQFRPGAAFDKLPDILHFGRVEGAAGHMHAVRRQAAEALQSARP